MNGFDIVLLGTHNRHIWPKMEGWDEDEMREVTLLARFGHNLVIIWFATFLSGIERYRFDSVFNHPGAVSVELTNDCRTQNSADFPESCEVCKISIMSDLHIFPKI